jgi:hypothetical protein
MIFFLSYILRLFSCPIGQRAITFVHWDIVSIVVRSNVFNEPLLRNALSKSVIILCVIFFGQQVPSPKVYLKDLHLTKHIYASMQSNSFSVAQHYQLRKTDFVTNTNECFLATRRWETTGTWIIFNRNRDPFKPSKPLDILRRPSVSSLFVGYVAVLQCFTRNWCTQCVA